MKRFWKKRLPAALLTLLMIVSMIPAAGAATADIVKDLEAGESVTFTRSTFRNLYNADTSLDSAFSYIVFTEYDGLDDYGYFTAFDQKGKEVTLKEEDLDSLWFYYNDSDIEYDTDCALSGLTFVAHEDAYDGTLTLEFLMCGESSRDEVAGTLDLNVSGGTADPEGSIIYEVAPGGETLFDAESFYDFFKFQYGGSSYNLRYVVFDKPTASALADGTLYYNYDLNSEEAFTRNSIAETIFYYSSGAYGDYPLDNLSFVADDTFSEDVSLTFRAYYSSNRYVDGTLVLKYTDKTVNNAEISYEVNEGESFRFDRGDFLDAFEKHYDDFCYVALSSSNLDKAGHLTSYYYDKADDEFYKGTLDEGNLDDACFYYYDRDVKTDVLHGYSLDDLTFVADKDAGGKTVTLAFTAFGEDTSDRVRGTVTISIDDLDGSGAAGAIEYDGAAEKQTRLLPEDFYEYFQETYGSYPLKYIRFTDSENLNSYNGYMYYNYDRSGEVRFTATSLTDATFYYDEDDIPTSSDDCYPIEDLSFVGSTYFDETVTLEFRAYYTTARYVDGIVTIKPDGSGAGVVSATVKGDILYTTTNAAAVQINANDFARFLKSRYPTSTLQSVKLTGVPSAGGLYYNYYGASKYGAVARLKLTAANCTAQNFYPNPTSTSQYALTELTYIPSGTNYCAAIPFTAYGSDNRSANGTVLISVSAKAVPEIYGLVTRNVAVSFPAPSMAAAVVTGTSSSLYGIQLLKLPTAAQGTVYVGTGTARKAATDEVYAYSGDGWTIGQLRFVPTTGYTGSVEIPYVACDANGVPIAAGKFCLGVVTSTAKKFSDVTSSTWCYKYVMELTDAKVISGYTDGTYKPDNTISYGAALKLIMLAAGYPEQAPVAGGGTFSGYLAKAQAEGIITRTNVNLNGPITRLQVAQLAAGAMKLDLDNLSTVNPFTDTTDAHVRALNAAGIVEGYFNNGTYAYRPNNTLTRGQVSAIVWRMRNAAK